MIKAIYVDEQEGQRRRFQLKVRNHIHTVALHPDPTIEECLEKIVHEHEAQAFITDFKLTEHDSKVQYDGAELAEAFLEIRPHFPCFVLTSFEDEAARNSSDVNRVYDRNTLSTIQPENKISFVDRVTIQVQNYQKLVANVEAEFHRLIEKKSAAGISISEEARLSELDARLEKLLIGKTMPREIKDHYGISLWAGLLDDTENLIAKMRSKGV